MIDKPIDEQKINEAYSIFASVGFIEREIFHQMTLLEEAVNNNFSEDVVIINKRIEHLYEKMRQECSFAEAFAVKYGKKNEEKTILSGVK